MAEVIGAIRDRWLALGGDGGVMGKALDVEKPTFDGVGRAQEFEGGTISWHPEIGAFGTWGAIRQRWLELGRERFGYPITDELPCPDGVGRFNHYRGMHLAHRPEASVYWTPSTGAHEVFGAIRDKWVSLGFEKSWLGYPTTGEVDYVESGRVGNFQHGAVYWWPDTGAIDLGDIVVRYRGMNCFGETDEGSGSDEPYVVVGVLAFDGQKDTFRTPIHDDVDAGGSFPNPGTPVYRGRPWGVDLSVTFMEHDEGDPNKYRDLVHKGVSEAANRAKPALQTALASTGFLAPLAIAVGPVLDAAVPVIVDAINGLLGTEDDTIGTQPVKLTAKQLCVLTAAGHAAERDVRFHVASPLVSGDGASYKAYFDIVRA